MIQVVYMAVFTEEQCPTIRASDIMEYNITFKDAALDKALSCKASPKAASVFHVHNARDRSM